MSKTKQAFDCQDLPQKLMKNVFDTLEIGCNGSYKTLYMDELKEDDPELYKWLIKNGYKKELNSPSGNCVLLIWW